MSEAIGALRARVALHSPTRTPDDLGGAAIAWTPEGEAWADVKVSGARAGAAFDTATAIAVYSVTIYRRDDVRPGWRVDWGGRTLRVISVRDEGAPRIVLNCEEESL